MIRHPPRSPPFPHPTLFRSRPSPAARSIRLSLGSISQTETPDKTPCGRSLATAHRNRRARERPKTSSLTPKTPCEGAQRRPPISLDSENKTGTVILLDLIAKAAAHGFRASPFLSARPPGRCPCF